MIRVKRPGRTASASTTEDNMRALAAGAAALVLSAVSASAQAMYPSYSYRPYGYGYRAPAPLYDYAGPASATPNGLRAIDLHTEILRTNSCLSSAAVGARLLCSAVSGGFAAVI